MDEVFKWRESCGFGECADEVATGLARHFDEVFEFPFAGAVLLHAADDFADAEEGGGVCGFGFLIGTREENHEVD